MKALTATTALGAFVFASTPLLLHAASQAPAKDISTHQEPCSNAVSVKSIADERKWISERFPGYTFVSQGLIGGEDGKKFDFIEFTTRDGEKKSQCFDITSFFGGGKYASKIRKRLSKEELGPYVLALTSDDKSKREDAIYRLSYVLPDAAEEAHVALVRGMSDSDFDIARSAIVQVGKFRPMDAVPRLIEMLRAFDQEKAGNAAHELRELGEAAKPAIPELELLLGSTRSRTRSSAAQTLDRLGVRSPRIVDVFEALLLRDANMWVRQETAYALRDYEHLGAAVIAMLEKTTTDKEGYVVESACYALKHYKTEEGKAAFSRAAKVCAAAGSRIFGK